MPFLKYIKRTCEKAAANGSANARTAIFMVATSRMILERMYRGTLLRSSLVCRMLHNLSIGAFVSFGVQVPKPSPTGSDDFRIRDVYV